MIAKWMKSVWWSDYCIEILPTGSRIICSPPPTNTDEDYLLLVDTATVNKLEERLVQEGFIHGGSFDSRVTQATIFSPEINTDNTIIYSASWDIKKYVSKHKKKILPDLTEFPDLSNKDKLGIFHSWKKDDLNLILTCSVEYFENFSKATRLAKTLNLINKQDRIFLFEAICFDNWEFNEEHKEIGF